MILKAVVGTIADLEGICYGLIATIKAMEREREENAS